MAKQMQGIEIHQHNPFSEVLEITTKKKTIRVGNGKQLVDTRTGEMENITHIVTYKEVDDEEFVKFYTGNIALTFDLSAAGNKAFQLVMRSAQKNAIGKDEIYLSDGVATEIAEGAGVKISVSTWRRGLKELLTKQVLAKSVKTNIYFINPHLMFNGDRYAFTQAVKRKDESSAPDEQKDMFITDPNS